MVDVDLSSLSSFKSGFAGVASYAWILYFLIPVAVIIFGVYLFKIIKQKKKQWTHTLVMRRVLTTGLLSKEVRINMKRFSLVKNASVFELEHPFLGGYLMPELDSYTGINEFSVIIDKNNRILISKGETFNPDTSYVNVSAKHAGIDLAFGDLNSSWTEINKTSKKMDLKEIMKVAMLGLLIIAVMVVAIKGIGQWGENHKADTTKAQAEAEAFGQLADAMQTSQDTMTATVMALDLFKEIYGTNNIQGIVQEKLNGTV